MTAQRGFPPTLAELARGMGLRNRMTVHQHVQALKRKGMVDWEPGLNRSLTLTDAASSEIHTGSKSGGAPAQSPQALRLAGTIAAGSPIDAIESQEYLGIESEYTRAGCFALKIKGDSMIDDGIFDGDYVIVRPDPSPKNGDIVVALLPDGTATLKRFFKEGRRFRLQPSNTALEPIYLDRDEEIQIQGKVLGLFRKF